MSNSITMLRPVGDGNNFMKGSSAMQVMNSDSPSMPNHLVRGIVIQNLPVVTIQITPHAHEARAIALNAAAMALSVTSDATKVIATEALQVVSEVIRDMENTRKDTKSQVDNIADSIQEMSKDFNKPLVEHKERLGRILGEYAMQEEAESQKSEQERVLELNRLAEQKRKADELASQSKDSKQSAEAAKAAHELTQKMKEASVPVKRQKEKGTAIISSWEVEVLDVNALFAARPDLVDLVPSKSRLNAALDIDSKIPGVKATKVTKMVSRK